MVYSSHCLSMSTASTEESKQTIIAERSRQNTDLVTPPPQKKGEPPMRYTNIQI